MVKKFISAIVGLTLLLSTCVVGLGATTFSDLDATKYSWAIEQITAMANKGIINGYPDGTYMPENKVTQNEMMLLIARILGSSDSVYADHKEEIKALYADDVKGMNLPYPYEVSFLLYRGVFTVSEVQNIVNTGINQPVKRYEAAIYLTKAMNNYDDVNTSYESNTGYADEASIPANARKFVKYVKDEGLMLGMTNTTFDPDYAVTRAQAAVLLYRTMEKQNILFVKGSLDKMDSDKFTLKLGNGKTNDYQISDLTTFAMNGKEVEQDQLRIDEEIIVMFQNNIPFRVEMLYEAPTVSNTVSGEVTQVVTSANSSIKLIDQADGVSKTYQASNTCEVFVNGSKATLSVVRLRDYAKLSLDSNDTAIRIDVMDSTQEFTDGTIQKLDLGTDLNVKIKRENGDIETYLTKSEVAIKRNGADASFRDIVVGDTITRCVTNYGRIVRLEVKSEIGTLNGKIEEIVISADPSVVINGNCYSLNRNIKVIVDGAEKDVYSLRLDMTAKVTTDSGTVTKIEVTSTSSEVGQVSGTVESVNTSYGYINLKLTDGTTRQIFVNSKNTTITDNSTGTTKRLQDIKVGDFLVVVGKSVSGAFEAKTIVIAN